MYFFILDLTRRDLEYVKYVFQLFSFFFVTLRLSILHFQLSMMDG